MRAQVSLSALITACALSVLCATCAAADLIETQPQQDGSTRVKINLGSALKGLLGGGQPEKTADIQQAPSTLQQTAPAPVAEQNQVVPPSPINSIRSTALAGIFAKHPWDGTPKSYFPRVSVTVSDWSRGDCWAATATIWWSKNKSEIVPPFSVCWGKTLGFAVNNAASLHLFMQQSSAENSGNVRTRGPKPPMIAIPDRQPIGESKQLDFTGFIEQLIVETGWQAGAPTNFWLVGYDANSGKVSSSR